MDLCNINEIKALLTRHGFHFSKAKGQNFLTQSWVPRDIVPFPLFRQGGIEIRWMPTWMPWKKR